MRVLIIAEHYPPTEGGVATSAQRIAHELSDEEIDVQIVCFDHSRPATAEDYTVEENDSRVAVARIGPFFLKQPGLSVDSLPEKYKATLRRRAFAQMVRIARGFRADVILSLYLLNAGFMAQFVGNELGIPVVAGVRGNDIGRNIFHVERFGVVQWVLTHATVIACVNEHLRRRVLLAYPSAAEKAIVIPNAVQLPVNMQRDEARLRVTKATGWPEKDLRLVFIGNLREKKGITVLLSALESLPAPGVRLLVVGPQPGSVERRLSGACIDRLLESNRLYCTGSLPRNEVSQWAGGGDVIVMPSLDDGMANGLLEGMAAGLCPLASDIFSDVVQHEFNGLVVPAGDARALASATSRLIGDPAAVQRLGRNAMEHMAVQHTRRNEGQAYVRTFQHAIRNYRTALSAPAMARH